MTDDERLDDLQIQVTAIKGILVSVIAALANRDPDLAREIIAPIPKFVPPGVSPIDPGLETLDAFLVCRDEILKDLRAKLLTEQHSTHDSEPD